MENKISFNTPKAPRLNPFIPQAVVAGGLIYVSGTAGVSLETGKLISDNYEEQAMQAFKNISIILEELGSDMGKVLKTTIWMVTGMDPDFSMTNGVYAHYFPTEPPARSAPQVMPFPGGILISVECIAQL